MPWLLIRKLLFSHSRCFSTLKSTNVNYGCNKGINPRVIIHIVLAHMKINFHNKSGREKEKRHHFCDHTTCPHSTLYISTHTHTYKHALGRARTHVCRTNKIVNENISLVFVCECAADILWWDPLLPHFTVFFDNKYFTILYYYSIDLGVMGGSDCASSSSRNRGKILLNEKWSS